MGMPMARQRTMVIRKLKVSGSRYKAPVARGSKSSAASALRIQPRVRSIIA